MLKFVSWHVPGKISTGLLQVAPAYELCLCGSCVRQWLSLSNGFFLLLPGNNQGCFSCSQLCTPATSCCSGTAWPLDKPIQVTGLAEKKEKKNKQKEWNIFSVGLMNKIESAKNLLSRSSAAAENSRIIQLRRRAEERRQPFLFEKSTQSVFLNCMVSCQGALQKKGEKTPYFLLLLVDIKSGKLKNWCLADACLPNLD